MKPLFLLLLIAAPARAQSVCYYNHRQHIVQLTSAYCSKNGQLVFDAISDKYTPSCGVRNTLNAFSWKCQKPCKAALSGIKNYRKQGKTVVVGPSLLPLDSNGKLAFAEYAGSCSDLRERLNATGKTPEGLDSSNDDNLIGAADEKEPD